MISVAFLAFLGHFLGMVVSKTGLFLQKLTHIEMERKKVYHVKFDDNFNRIETTDDKKPVYYSGKWIFGFMLLLLGGLIQLIVLPYADLVLLSTNSISAIAYNSILAISCLGEKFVCKYDLPAFVLMGAGAFTIVMLASITEKVFTSEEILNLLFSYNSLYFAAGTSIFIFATAVYIRVFKRQIQEFQEDLEAWTKE